MTFPSQEIGIAYTDFFANILEIKSRIITVFLKK